MSGSFYGDGILYGSDDYGLLTPAEIDALDEPVRQTTLECKIYDDNVNSWSFFTGQDLNLEVEYKPVPLGPFWAHDHRWWGYRGQAMMVKTTDGKIHWYRIGRFNDITNRNIYSRVITDPTIKSQWRVAWTPVYTNTHYALAIQPKTSSTVDVYRALGDGLYVNSTQKWAKTGIVRIWPIEGQIGAMYIACTTLDPQDPDDDRGRILDLYWTPDINTTTPVADPTNFRWYNNSAVGIKLSATRVRRVHAWGYGMHPRDRGSGQTLTSEAHRFDAQSNLSEPDFIRGMGGGAGYNTIENPYVTKLGDYYYLFYGERHRDFEGSLSSNLRQPVVWQRSKDMINWSEPVHMGFTVWGFAGVVEHSGYYWLAGNGAVYRRPSGAVVHDLTNYVTGLELQIPRENQPGTANVNVANPDNIIGEKLGLTNISPAPLTDRRCDVYLGFKTAKTGGYSLFKQNDWWTSAITREDTASASRVTIQLGDFWYRLNNEFRDTFNYEGQLKWNDFYNPQTRNKLFNYFAPSATLKRIASDTPGFAWPQVSRGHCLFTGWKGYNPDTRSSFILSNVNNTQFPLVYDCSLIFRYKDPQNYYYLNYRGTILRLGKVVGGVNNIYQDFSLAAKYVNKVRIQLRVIVSWKVIKCYINDTLQFTFTETTPEIWKGFSGVSSSMRNYWFFHFTVWDEPTAKAYQTADLIKKVLAFGDYHDVIVGNADNDMLSVIWGPQTDLKTPADALRYLMDSEKMQAVWHSNTNTIQVGRFRDQVPNYVIENQLMEVDQLEEASRRVNIVSVDGREHSWIEIDVEDVKSRDRDIVRYVDAPELRTQSAVQRRALEEVTEAKRSISPGGRMIWMPWLRRLDPFRLIDNVGRSFDVRLEGMTVEVNQSTNPFQRAEIDTSPIYICIDPAVTYESTVLALENLDAYWPLYESNTQNDAKEVKNNQILGYVGSPIRQYPGLILGEQSSSVWFDGINDVIQRGSPVITQLNNWTMCALVEPDFDASLPRFIMYNGTDANGYGFCLGGPDTLTTRRISVLFGSASWYDTGSDIDTSLQDKRYHLGITRTTDNFLHFYVNGLEVISFNSATPPITPATRFSIGAQRNSADSVWQRFFKGAIGNAFVVARALSATEMLLLYQQSNV